jgi:hypothetical protein
MRARGRWRRRHPSRSDRSHWRNRGLLFGRFDLAVAVFFALSGFLCGVATLPPPADCGSPADRALPAVAHRAHHAGYLVAVVVILTLLPDAKADLTVWLANCR